MSEDSESDEKVRRNLVIASSLVLLAAWLDLPMGSLADRLLGAKFDCAIQVPAWRVWVAVLAVMTYLTHRYAFSQSAAAAYKDLGNAWNVASSQISRRLGSARVRAHLVKKTDHKLRALTGEPLDIWGSGTSSERLGRMISGKGWFAEFQPGVGDWRFGTVQIGSQNEHIAYSGRALLGLSDQRLVQLRVAVRVTAFSGLTGELFVPVLLTLFAWGTALYYSVTTFVH